MKVCEYFIFIIILLNPAWADWDIRWCDVNQWECALSNYGNFAHNNNQAGGFWRKNKGHEYIFGAGIWVGCILPNGDTVVTVGYDPHNATSEFAPGIAYANPNDPQWHVYFSTDSNYPLPVLSYLDCYCSFNDFDTLWHQPDSFHIKEPLGITITRITSSWLFFWRKDVVFIEYRIKNDTTYTLNNLYTGVSVDFDIGSRMNDRGALDLQRKLGYAWQEEPEPGWDWVGKFACKLLSTHPLAAFKQFTNWSEPVWDNQRYLSLAGYNYYTGQYVPYDSFPSSPDDRRFLFSSGPFDLPPGDSLVLNYAIFGARDTASYDTTDLKMKADSAQRFYDCYHNYGCHDVLLSYPNGNEVLNGNIAVTYTATSGTGNPLTVDVFLSADIDETWFKIDSLLNNTGTYSWNTINHPDGVFYKLAILAYDSLTVGMDISDNYFTIDNPGNGAPGLLLYSPNNYDTLSGNCDITWFARDPEFYDSLYINFYYRGQYDTTFQAIALDEPNDSIYTWNTVPYRNGLGTLIVETYDEEFTVAETVQVNLLNEVPGGEINHLSGLNNCVDLSVLIHEPQYITGHTYELEFLQYRALLHETYYYPEYIYQITDSNTGATVIDTYSLKNGYAFLNDRITIDDFSPIIDGYSMHGWTDDSYGYKIMLYNFHNDSVDVVLGSYPEDSIYCLGSMGKIWWAYRGSRLQLDWVTHANGGLTLLVTDLDYGDTIPYKPYNWLGTLNPDSAFGWCFHPFVPPSGPPSDTLRPGYDRFIMLCGDRIRFSHTISPPQSGDRWIVYPGEYAPPIKGNVYRFTPQVSIKEYDTEMTQLKFQVYPVPCKDNLVVSYNILKRQKVKLVIYDVCGRRVKLFKNGIVNPGTHTISWNGLDERNRKVSAGIYFCRFEAEGSYSETKKFIIVK